MCPEHGEQWGGVVEGVDVFWGLVRNSGSFHKQWEDWKGVNWKSELGLYTSVR